ncbi:hypothetical protein D9757_003228 [Collybiopsis confluens]|uniref:tryptophan--tRNA ligase n=1 Tax=Collybiopsis confluens TaxID=2823264 RepID=A0A8H5HZ41_9AGAR|nr:hypothetical protein D9757_003228 [Collybiopsis confluens]
MFLPYLLAYGRTPWPFVSQLGNYLGALVNWVKLQNSSQTSEGDAAQEADELLFSIVGWHALTLPQNPAQLAEARMDMLAVLLAIGLDPKKSVIFFQEDNPNHTELAWILSCITPVGKLRRMTTWKARLATARNHPEEQQVQDALKDANSEVDETGLNAGLFTYPVLQAADILVYRATHVPVGDDQTQHLELCRDLADQFNRTYKSKYRMFPLPVQLNTPSSRILSLRSPTSKMSKSSPDAQSRILLTDSTAVIASKIKSAVTDSIQGITWDPVGRPGTANLLSILAACNGDESVKETASRYQGKNHGALKRDVTEAVEEMLKGPRREFERLKGDREYLRNIAREGAEKARVKSEVTMKEVRGRIGLA